MKHAIDKKIPLWQVCLGIIIVIFITAIGLVMLYQERLAENLTPPASSYEPVEISTPSPEKAVRSEEGKLNLNTAGKEELMTLPGIGEALAERIIVYRSETPFKQVRDLKKISGIGEKIYQTLQALVYVE